MNYRYSLGWMQSNPLGHALKNLFEWHIAAPRDSRLFPGIIEPIPQGNWGGDASDFERIALQAAEDMWGRTNEIVVCWSGGTDSTLATSLLLARRGEGQSLAISCDEATVAAACPEFISWLLQQGVPYLPMDMDMLRAVGARGGRVTTGWHADTLIGGDPIRTALAYETVWDMSEIDLFYILGKNTHLSDKAIFSMIGALEPALALCPFERNAANSSWWLDYISTWFVDELSPMLLCGLQPRGIGYENFYADPNIQRWMMQPVANKVGRTELTWKKLYRDLIFKLNGFSPALTMGDTPNDDVGEKIDSMTLLAVREDWSPIYRT